jgi:uncharacterized protein (TIGR00251 family)
LSASRPNHTLPRIADELTIQVRVTPRAKRNAVTRTPDGSLKVYVTAPPEDGRANDAVIEVLADWLGVKRRQVEIIRGATSRNKVVRVTKAKVR